MLWRLARRALSHWIGVSVFFGLILLGAGYVVGARNKAEAVAAASEGCAVGLARNRAAPMLLKLRRFEFCSCVAEETIGGDWALLHIPELFVVRIKGPSQAPLDRQPMVRACASRIDVQL